MEGYFGTDGIRGVANIFPITPSFAVVLSSILGAQCDKILIGTDTRFSSEMLKHALISGAISNGADAWVLGCMPTPCVSLFTRTFEGIGIMVTASHNPFNHNGFKIFNSKGVKLSLGEESDLETKIRNKDYLIENPLNIGCVKYIQDTTDFYLDHILSRHQIDLSEFKVVVNCSNGACFIAPKILENLGVDVYIVSNSPDGMNINEKCNDFGSIIREEGADLGFVLDGDGDRVSVYDEQGFEILGDHILGFLAKHLLNDIKKHSKNVVSTIMSTISFEEYITNLGLKLIRSSVGDRNVAYAMQKYSSFFGGEQSGHIIIDSPTGDGIDSAIYILKFLKHERLPASLALRPFQHNVQLFCDIISNHHQSDIELIKQEAMKILNKNGRVIIRKSGTENLTRVMVESKDEALANSTLEFISKNFK